VQKAVGLNRPLFCVLALVFFLLMAGAGGAAVAGGTPATVFSLPLPTYAVENAACYNQYGNRDDDNINCVHLKQLLFNL
jgi:hypothetical protein